MWLIWVSKSVLCANGWRSSIVYMTCIQVSTWSAQASFSFYCLKKYMFLGSRYHHPCLCVGILRFQCFLFCFFSSSEPKATSCSGILTTWLQKQQVELEVRCEPRASPPDIWISSLTGGRKDQVTLLPHFYVPPLLCQIAQETIPLQSGAFNTRGAFYTKCEKCWVNLWVNFSSCVICVSPTIWLLDTQMVHMHAPLIKYQKWSIARSNEAIVHDCLVHRSTCRKWWLHRSQHIGP